MQNAISPTRGGGRAATPVGPCSPAMVLERLVFVSGQGATDPVTGQVAGSDIETQTKQIMRSRR